MKRYTHKSIILKESRQKRQCRDYLEKFKEEHAHEWTFHESDKTFVDNKDQSLVRAYILNGKLYDAKSELVNLKALDMPKNICVDVWYLILRWLGTEFLISIQCLNKKVQKAVQNIWKERANAIADLYGPVFEVILQRRKLTYARFFHLCTKRKWYDDWIPFETLFRLPPGAALAYIGKGGPCSASKSHKQTYGVILTRHNQYAGFVKPLKKNSIQFYWHLQKGRVLYDIREHAPNNLSMNNVLLGMPITSLIADWAIYASNK